MTEQLNELASKYLDENGLKVNFFARYIGCEYSYATRWLKGERKNLSQRQLEKVHSFLNGKHLKSVPEIVKGE